MKIYTTIIEYRSGTYVGQFLASSYKDCAVQAIKDLDLNPIKHIGGKSKKFMLDKILHDDDALFELNGIRGVMRCIMLVNHDLLFMTIVNTLCDD